MANLTFQKRDLRDKLVMSRDTNTNNESFFENEKLLKKLKNNIIEQRNYIDVEN